MMGDEAKSARTDPARLEALYDTKLLDAASRESFDRLTRLAVNFLDVPAAFICLVDRNRDFFLSQHGLPDSLAQRRQVEGETFCEFTIESTGPLLIEDVRAKPAYQNIPAVKSLGVRAYAGIPLRLQNGAALGTFSVIHFKPHAWDRRQVELLQDLAHLTMAEIERESSAVALKSTEQRYSELFESVPVGLYRTAPEGRFLDANERMVALLGYPDRETLLSTPIPSLYVDPADRTRWTAALAKDGVVRDYEFQLRRRGGEIIWVRDTTRVIWDSEGRVRYYEGALEDISDAVESKHALQQSEDYFRALTEKSMDIITVVEVDGTIRYESPSVLPYLGFAPEELAGKSVFSYVHPDDAGRIITAFTSMLANNAPSVTARLRFRHKDGSWHILDATATNLVAHPPVNGVVVNSRDVTEQVELEEQVRQGSKMEAIGQLAGGVAHDFNNILTSIRGTADVLLEDLAGHPAEEDLLEIRKAADRAAELTRQLLAFSRRQVLQPHIVDLNGTISGMHRLLERLIGPLIEIRFDLAPDRVETTVDPNQIERVILNLAVNSRDAMPHGGTLTLQTSTCRITPGSHLPLRIPPGEYAEICISDTGTGIAPEHLSKIFEPFFTTKAAGEGTGLGLATVFGIVEQSHGFIWAENRPAGGTLFRLLFPHTPDDSVPSTVAPDTSKSSMNGCETILVVDDDEHVGRLTSRILKRFGYKVLTAVNAESAMAASREYADEIHLLLTDIVMPRVRGPELASQFRKERPNTKIVYMSGYNEEAVAQHGIVEQGAQFIEKPFEMETIGLTIRRALESASEGSGKNQRN